MLRDYPKDQDLMRIRCHGAFKKNKGGLTSERYFSLLRFHPKKDVPKSQSSIFRPKSSYLNLPLWTRFFSSATLFLDQRALFFFFSINICQMKAVQNNKYDNLKLMSLASHKKSYLICVESGNALGIWICGCRCILKISGF